MSGFEPLASAAIANLSWNANFDRERCQDYQSVAERIESRRTGTIGQAAGGEKRQDRTGKMRIEGASLEELRRGIQSWKIPKGQKIHYEFLPLLSWAAVPLFAELLDGPGPFVLEYEPRGNVPPDWTITSGTMTTAIEVVQFVTQPMGAVARHAQTPVDTTHLLLDRWPDENFVADLKAGRLCGTDLESDAVDAQAVEDTFFTIAERELRKKYRALPSYRGSYARCILLIWDTLGSADATFVDRPAVLRGWLKNAPAGGFDAVIMADGNCGAAAHVDRLK